MEHIISESLMQQSNVLSSDMREQKVLELAKKARRLYVALEKEKSRSMSLAQKVKVFFR